MTAGPPRFTWFKCRKKPVIVEVRNVVPGTDGYEYIQTREGLLAAHAGKHYVIRGVKGELYPIEKSIFDETYEFIRDESGCILCGGEERNPPIQGHPTDEGYAARVI